MKGKRFFDLFPPPEFLTMPSIGLSLECDALRIVSLKSKHGHLGLDKTAEIKLEEGTINAGDIVKPEKLASAFENIYKEHGARFARVALPEEKAYVYEVLIPVPEEGDLTDAVEFSLDQNIPLTAAEAVFDYAIVEGPFSNSGVQTVRVAVTAYPRQNVETLTELLKQAGISPIAMTPESQAVARSLMIHGDTQSTLLVHFMKDKTIILVSSGGFVRFATSVPTSLEHEHAEKLLNAHADEKIAESVELLAVRDEVKKIYSYWMSNQGAKTGKESKGINSIIVSGHVHNMTDVADYLGKHVGVPAHLGNVWANAFSLDDVVPELEFDDSLRFAAAVGVALPMSVK